MAKTIKEIIIMLVVCLVTMLLLAIILYQYIPNRKVVPEIAKYTVSDEVQDLLEDNIDTKKDDDNVILTYEVTSNDLNNYKNTNVYVPGKSNPFAKFSEQEEGEVQGTENGDNSGNETQTNTNSGLDTKTPDVYQSNGTK
jgi:hypothetical protein